MPSPSIEPEHSEIPLHTRKASLPDFLESIPQNAILSKETVAKIRLNRLRSNSDLVRKSSTISALSDVSDASTVISTSSPFFPVNKNAMNNSSHSSKAITRVRSMSDASAPVASPAESPVLYINQSESDDNSIVSLEHETQSNSKLRLLKEIKTTLLSDDDKIDDLKDQIKEESSAVDFTKLMPRVESKLVSPSTPILTPTTASPVFSPRSASLPSHRAAPPTPIILHYQSPSNVNSPVPLSMDYLSDISEDQASMDEEVKRNTEFNTSELQIIREESLPITKIKGTKEVHFSKVQRLSQGTTHTELDLQEDHRTISWSTDSFIEDSDVSARPTSYISLDHSKTMRLPTPTLVSEDDFLTKSLEEALKLHTPTHSILESPSFQEHHHTITHVLILKDESCQTVMRESNKSIQTLPLEGLVPETEYNSKISQLTKEKNEIILENTELKSQINQLQRTVNESKDTWESMTLKAYRKIKEMDMEKHILSTELKSLKLQLSSLEKEFCKSFN